MMTGARNQATWQDDNLPSVIDFYDLKGVIESLLQALHIEDYTVERSTHTSFHPGRSANLLIRGNSIGTFGELHPKVAQRFKLTEVPVVYAELQVAPLIRYHQRLHTVSALSTTPSVLEDIALIVNMQVTAGEVEDVIRKAGGRLLKDVQLFDVYMGDPIPAGKKSLAYALTYRDDEKTLTDKNVLKIRKKIIGAAQHRLKAELRS